MSLLLFAAGHRQDMTTLRINDIKLNIDAINE